jgi:Protein of unknown function (DUF4019)
LVWPPWLVRRRGRAESWLAIVDAGKYGDSWERAGTAMQKGISKPNWEQAVGGVRAQVGPLKSRALLKGDAAPKATKAGGNDAVVIQYATAFEKFAANEVVTSFREQDGVWKVAGYLVKPAVAAAPTVAADPAAKQDANP